MSDNLRDGALDGRPVRKIEFSQTSNGAGGSGRNQVATSRNRRRSHPPGGARRDRTDDLLLAKQALSQLSYGPFREQVSAIRDQASAIRHQNPIPDD